MKHKNEEVLEKIGLIMRIYQDSVDGLFKEMPTFQLEEGIKTLESIVINSDFGAFEEPARATRNVLLSEMKEVLKMNSHLLEQNETKN